MQQWQKEDVGYKRKKRTKTERKENPMVFKSSNVYVQEHSEELTSPTMHHSVGVKYGQVIQKGFEDSPEKATIQKTVVCAL